MSRVGKQPIPIPKGADISIDGGVFVAKGPKGTVSQTLIPGYPVEIADGEVQVSRPGDSGEERSKHGLLRALLANAVTGVTEGFSKQLEINGVGYKAEVNNREINFSLGYSHPVIYEIPDAIEVEIDKSLKITVSGADRQQVGQVAAEIRSLRKPDPYKAKGIKYVDEIVRRKVGKAGAR